MKGQRIVNRRRETGRRDEIQGRRIQDSSTKRGWRRAGFILSPQAYLRNYPTKLPTNGQLLHAAALFDASRRVKLELAVIHMFLLGLPPMAGGWLKTGTLLFPTHSTTHGAPSSIVIAGHR
jgi:hypothetical protein